MRSLPHRAAAYVAPRREKDEPAEEAAEPAAPDAAEPADEASYSHDPEWVPAWRSLQLEGPGCALDLDSRWHWQARCIAVAM